MRVAPCASTGMVCFVRTHTIPHLAVGASQVGYHARACTSVLLRKAAEAWYPRQASPDHSRVAESDDGVAFSCPPG